MKKFRAILHSETVAETDVESETEKFVTHNGKRRAKIVSDYEGFFDTEASAWEWMISVQLAKAKKAQVVFMEASKKLISLTQKFQEVSCGKNGSS